MKEYEIIEGTPEAVKKKMNELYAEELGSKGKTQIIPLGFGMENGVCYQGLIIVRVEIAQMGAHILPTG